MYGSKGLWEGYNGLFVLDYIFQIFLKYKIPILWVGIPIEYLNKIKNKIWESILVTFLELLNNKFILDKIKVQVVGDRNSWIPANHALKLERWSNFLNSEVIFMDSAEIHGIQLADIISHTLFRSNKNLSNTDKTANNFRLQISNQIFHLEAQNI